MPLLPFSLRLFEFCDQRTLPPWVREAFMDCLTAIYKISKPYNGYSEQLMQQVQGEEKIIDLASGGGEGGEFFLNYLEKNHPNSNLKIVGTDLYPDLQSLKIMKAKYKNFDFIPEPISALNPPPSNIYTMFTAFHHFKEDLAISLLQNCLTTGKQFIVFEITVKNCSMTYITSILNFFPAMFVPFFAKRWDWRKIIFSTLIPIIPFFLSWDGVVSGLRTYTKKELQDLATKASPDGRIKMDYTEKRYFGILHSYMCRFYVEE